MIGSTFSSFHSPGVSHQFWCCFSSSFSTFEDQRRVSFKSCPFSRRFVVLASCYPLKLFLVVQFFSSIRSISGAVFSLDHLKAIFSEDFFVLSFQIRSPIILYSCPFVRLHILPVLRSSMLQSARDRFFQLHLDSLKYIRAFPIFPGESFSFVIQFWILTVVRSRPLVICNHIN